ncbi:MAG: hypothetical protein BMS9Abin20_1163 [Acidimicrobiia bacterium]|nr:MAG: hypothetical protein BMS9Abin20_1163 [Acidimicrobiia bacterium]
MAYRRRSAIAAGTITGVRFAVKSLEPSLMPRSAIDQGLITGGSFLTGFLAGSGVARAARAIPIIGSSPVLRLVGLTAAGLRPARMLRSRVGEKPTHHHPAEGWIEIGAEIAGAIALSGLVDGSTPATKLTTIAAIGIASAADGQSAIAHRTDSPDIGYLATAGGVAAGANAAAGGLAGLVMVGAKLPTRLTRSSSVLSFLAAASGGILMAGGIALGVKLAAAKVISGIEAGNAGTEIAFAEAPASHAVSGSTYSLASYDTLGLQGRRLVSDATPPEVIEDVMGEPARTDAVRVYVGTASAESDDERVELAIQELRRAGGFDRRTIIAASPAGTGYVNYITVEAAELMARGDVATVAVQYGGLPSMLSIGRVARASTLYASLLRRLREEIDRLDRDIQLVAYGESLGALTSQNGVREASGVDGLIVDAALWVGTPLGSALFSELTGNGGVPVFDRYERYAEAVSRDGERPMVTLLNHDNDPVTKFTPSIAYRMPTWLMPTDRGRGTNPYQRWLPAIAFWQGLIDTKNAATVVPGEFKSTGHDYRMDLARFVCVAYGFDNVTDEQMARIEDRLRKSEIRRAGAIAEGRVQTA